MTTGLLVLNFGEPPEPDREVVEEYLERIFFANAAIEGDAPEHAARERARELAEQRAPGLIEEYEALGGSPLNEQARAQTEALESTLRADGHDVRAYVGMQYTDPLIRDAVEAARADGADHLVAVTGYPLCGPSTTVAALEQLRRAIPADWDVPVDEVTGWHRHPTYTRLRADALRQSAADAGVDLHDPATMVVFSAHGTPVKYLDEGSRYRTYVEEYCETQAAVLGLEEYRLGFQNHANRDVEWTQPDVESVVEALGVDGTDDRTPERVLVDPVSFVHEQSETLGELDDDLAEDAAEAGLEFHRVPVPHDDPRLAEVLADLVTPFVAGADPEYYQLRGCECRDHPDATCLNAPR